MSKIQTIQVADINHVIEYAADEMRRYLLLMAADKLHTEITVVKGVSQDITTRYRIGLYDSFGIKPLKNELNSELDDEIYIKTENGKGIIAGVNPRSVLFAVYFFLTEAGCRWVRPGKDGESIPETDISQLALEVHECPSYRYRGICIEGAVSCENVLEMIDWLPKVGLNSYFIQFREAYAFFERWHNHTYNSLKRPEPFSLEKAREYVKIIEKEIEKRGLVYHAVGHGWTCEPLGIPGLSWDPVVKDYPMEISKYFAEVNGKREMSDDIPLNVNLCYSNPDVRKIMINGIIDYLKKNERIDVLHFWLADGVNNQCECINCRDSIPSDFYVQMLNELDVALTENNIGTKIVFLIYLDLLWAPEKNTINNPDRFIMMFAPISRIYSQPFTADNVSENVAAYERNKLSLPSSVAENLAFLKKWQASFKGDSFDFDYHFMWNHYCDPGYIKISEVLHKDIQNLNKNGLNGLISCQPQRVFFPTGLGMYTLARTLWNSALEFDEIAADYFNSAFGDNGIECLKYMRKISEQFVPPYIMGEMNMLDTDISQRFSLIKDLLIEYEELIRNNEELGSNCHKKSWQYLGYHKEICALLAEMLTYRAKNDLDRTRQKWAELKEYLQKNEDSLQKVLDIFEFIITFEVVKEDILMLK